VRSTKRAEAGRPDESLAFLSAPKGNLSATTRLLRLIEDSEDAKPARSRSGVSRSMVRAGSSLGLTTRTDGAQPSWRLVSPDSCNRGAESLLFSSIPPFIHFFGRQGWGCGCLDRRAIRGSGCLGLASQATATTPSRKRNFSLAEAARRRLHKRKFSFSRLSRTTSLVLSRNDIISGLSRHHL